MGQVHSASFVAVGVAVAGAFASNFALQCVEQK
jgi:hypothetical protein